MVTKKKRQQKDEIKINKNENINNKRRKTNVI